MKSQEPIKKSKLDFEFDSDSNADYSLLAPGPVNLHPEVRKILALPMIHHRTPEFDAILARVLAGLKKIFCTDQPVYILNSTGSGGMESLVVNTLSPGDKAVVINSGKFGERWLNMLTAFGIEAIEIIIPWGEAVEIDQVNRVLQDNSDVRAVLCQACETSTGVAHPIKSLGSLIKGHPDCLFLVDGITALGAYPLPMDEYSIDGLVGGSQKAFMLPTGLSFVSFSKKAWRFIEQSKCPKFYFDIRHEANANKKGETFFSSSVALIRSLDFVLSLIENASLKVHFQDIRRRAKMVREIVPELGFNLYSKAPSDSVTSLAVPMGFDGQKIRSSLEEQFNITIMGGQDQAKGKIIRIGHMGYIQDQELVRLVWALGKTLQTLQIDYIDDERIELITNKARKWLQEN